MKQFHLILACSITSVTKNILALWILILWNRDENITILLIRMESSLILILYIHLFYLNACGIQIFFKKASLSVNTLSGISAESGSVSFALVSSWKHSPCMVMFQARYLFVYVESVHILLLSKIDFEALTTKAMCADRKSKPRKQGLGVTT